MKAFTNVLICLCLKGQISFGVGAVSAYRAIYCAPVSKSAPTAPTRTTAVRISRLNFTGFIQLMLRIRIRLDPDVFVQRSKSVFRLPVGPNFSFGIGSPLAFLLLQVPYLDLNLGPFPDPNSCIRPGTRLF
jgi:hypothetical protein